MHLQFNKQQTFQINHDMIITSNYYLPVFAGGNE